MKICKILSKIFYLYRTPKTQSSSQNKVLLVKKKIQITKTETKNVNFNQTVYFLCKFFGWWKIETYKKFSDMIWGILAKIFLFDIILIEKYKRRRRHLEGRGNFEILWNFWAKTPEKFRKNLDFSLFYRKRLKRLEEKRLRQNEQPTLSEELPKTRWNQADMRRFSTWRGGWFVSWWIQNGSQNS